MEGNTRSCAPGCDSRGTPSAGVYAVPHSHLPRAPTANPAPQNLCNGAGKRTHQRCALGRDGFTGGVSGGHTLEDGDDGGGHDGAGHKGDKEAHHILDSEEHEDTAVGSAAAHVECHGEHSGYRTTSHHRGDHAQGVSRGEGDGPLGDEGSTQQPC